MGAKGSGVPLRACSFGLAALGLQLWASMGGYEVARLGARFLGAAWGSQLWKLRGGCMLQGAGLVVGGCRLLR